MPEDRVTITADASQYFDVLSRAGVAADRLGSRGDRIGAGFLRGDRAVRVATQNITAGLLSATNATDAALIAMQSLERVFRIPIGATIGVAAGVAVLQVLYAQIKKTEQADKDLREELGKSLGLELQGNVDSLSGSIDKLTQKMAALRKEMNSPTQKFVDLFDPNKLPQGLGGTAAGIKAGVPAGQNLSQPVKDLIAAEEKMVKLSSERANKELKIAEAKRDENKFAQLVIEYESKRANLFQGAFKSGLNMVDLMKRLIGLQINLNSELAKENELRHRNVADAVARFRKSSGDLFHDIGSGQFLKDLQQRNLDNQITQQGQDMAKEFMKFGPTFDENGNIIDVGHPEKLGPNAQAMINAARGAAGKGGQGIDHLLELDFSNLDPLSKYDFSGLAPLSGLTLMIQ